jgi:hypothetical protein
MYKKIVSYLVVLVIGAAAGTYFDAKHTIEEKVIYKDRVRTQIKEVIKEAPDGTKVTERYIHKDEKKDKKVARKESIPVKPNWGVGIKYDLFSPVPVYGVDVHRRIFGDVYLTVYGRTDQTFGLGVLYTF